MTQNVTLGRKGEVVLPRHIRGQLGLQPGDELELSVENESIVLRKKAGRFGTYLERIGRRGGPGRMP